MLFKQYIDFLTVRALDNVHDMVTQQCDFGQVHAVQHDLHRNRAPAAAPAQVKLRLQSFTMQSAAPTARCILCSVPGRKTRTPVEVHALQAREGKCITGSGG